MDIRTCQQAAWANKIAKGFTLDNVPLEFMLLVKELGEAFDDWRKDEPGLGEELADVFIFLCGLAEMTGTDLQAAVEAKLGKNAGRIYRCLPNGTRVKTGA
jgi:NTP pyrophosphatase (non-canonical NTP hydrolase)